MGRPSNHNKAATADELRRNAGSNPVWGCS